MYENIISQNYEDCNWLNIKYGDQMPWFSQNWGFLECRTFGSRTVPGREGELIILTCNQLLNTGKTWFVKSF